MIFRKIMVRQTDEIDLVMAIENIGNEMKKLRETNYRWRLPANTEQVLEEIAGSLELIALAMQGVLK